MDNFKIEKNIPIPPAKPRGNRGKWTTLEVGDSVFLAGVNMQGANNRLAYVRTVRKQKFTVRHVDGGVRVWRTA